ncbi:hypothetical protein ACWDV4_07630 [Micromonospora sp. NPDC003197]
MTQWTLLRTGGPLLVPMTLALLMSGCATTEPDNDTAGQPSPPAATASAAATPTTVPTPTVRPSGASPSVPPKKPTDEQATDRIAGRVTRGGSGPCYGVVTDDGKEYALYGSDVGTLQVDSFVRVTIAPLLLRISCGPGTHASIVELSVVR